jgi:inorganic pyrophosphatase/exopolyphosphatase
LSVFDVPCIGEIDFHDLVREDKTEKTTLRIILVDHNNIFDETLESKYLVEIIDHHQKCKLVFGENVKLTFESFSSLLPKNSQYRLEWHTCITS